MREDRFPESREKNQYQIYNHRLLEIAHVTGPEKSVRILSTTMLFCGRFLLVDETVVFQLVSVCLNSGMDNFNHAETQYSGLCSNFYGVLVY